MGRVSLQSERLTPVLTDRALTLAVGNREVLAWDLAGRLYSMWRDGRTSRRGLSGRILRKWHDGGGAIHREWLDAAASDAVVTDAARRAAQCRATLSGSRDLAGRRATLSGSPDLLQALDRAASFDAAAARADADRFAGIYSDIGILPPDQYLALVVQATEGCSFHTCEFCDLYGQTFRARSADEFAGHVTAVRAFMGDSLRLRRRSVFVGAANALAPPMSRLDGIFSVIAREFPELPITGFVDAHTGAQKRADDWRQLGARGLRRVYVGLESGHDPLLELVRKPARSAEAVAAIENMQQGGIDVAVIVMIGLGGREFSSAHIEDTIKTVNRMALGAGDLVYFSDLVAPPGARYAALASSARLTPLTVDERMAQRRRIRDGLRFASAPVRTATYDIREFIY